MKYVNDQFKYGFSEEQLLNIIHAVGGYNADSITFDKFSKYISKRVAQKKILWKLNVNKWSMFNYSYYKFLNQFFYFI